MLVHDVNPNLQVVFRGDDGSLHLKLREVQREYHLSLCFDVEAKQSDFVLESRQVWVEQDRFAAFVRDFAECERTRQGTAELVSMSPNELTLRCSRSDGMGHFAVDYRLEVRLGLDASVILNGRFILDSEFFAHTVRELEDILDFCRTTDAPESRTAV
jgi:hypothetical protein